MERTASCDREGFSMNVLCGYLIEEALKHRAIHQEMMIFNSEFDTQRIDWKN